ncbi:hypothetical protein M0R04_05945 [Candidatus Dojkabacteria bacterium]|jgi:RNA polymerase sigma factor (sigma-70 family)|nr:hypothetical protein [Candidatus Dojkabacteria bacterium]
MKSKRDELIKEGTLIVDKLLSCFTKKHHLYAFMSKEDIEDMRSACIVEIITRIDCFDSSRDVKLLTYLYPRINGFFKDYLSKEIRHRKTETGFILDRLSEVIDNYLDFSSEQAIQYLKNETMCIGTINDDISTILSNELRKSLSELDKEMVYVILGVYILNKNIIAIAKELDYSETSGWVYKIKKKALVRLKESLEKKGVKPKYVN